MPYFFFERATLFMNNIINFIYYSKNQKCIQFRFTEKAANNYQIIN